MRKTIKLKRPNLRLPYLKSFAAKRIKLAELGRELRLAREEYIKKLFRACSLASGRQFLDFLDRAEQRMAECGLYRSPRPWTQSRRFFIHKFLRLEFTSGAAITMQRSSGKERRGFVNCLPGAFGKFLKSKRISERDLMQYEPIAIRKAS